MSTPAPAPRVLQVAHGWPPERIGGVELYVQALHHGLREHGVHSTVFNAGDAALATPQRLQVIGPHPDPRTFRETVVRPDVEARFRAWIVQQRPTIVHFHHLTHLSLGLPRVAAELGALTLMTLHDYWLPCVRGQLVDRTLERCPGPAPVRCAWCVSGQLALNPGTAVLGRVLSGLPSSWRARAREALPKASDRLEAVIDERSRLVRAAMGRIHRFASPSHDLSARMASLELGVGRIDHQDLPLVHPVHPAPPPGHGPVRFLFLGSLIPTKGPHLLLDAFARLPAGAATLHFAGPAPALDLDPDYARRLTARAAGIPGVTLEPAFEPGQVQPRLDAADVLVLPSLWEENSPLVVREATAAGLRVIASRRGGIRELAPEARFMEPTKPHTIFTALAAELRQGRGRAAPVSWDSTRRHAERVLAWYHHCARMD